MNHFHSEEVPPIGDLWHSQDPLQWEQARSRYWDFVKRPNLDLEQRMDSLDAERIRQFDVVGWYDFLLRDYFRWKYTAPNRYATTTRHLRDFAEGPGGLAALARIKDRLFALDVTDIMAALAVACEIKGLGPAGGSGLLAVLFPAAFGTADQFVVKALQQVPDLPEAPILATTKPEQLTLKGAATLVAIMRRKAAENNQAFRTSSWTPRKVDMVLWTYGR